MLRTYTYCTSCNTAKVSIAIKSKPPHLLQMGRDARKFLADPAAIYKALTEKLPDHIQFSDDAASSHSYGEVCANLSKISDCNAARVSQ